MESLKDYLLARSQNGLVPLSVQKAAVHEFDVTFPVSLFRSWVGVNICEPEGAQNRSDLP